MEITLCIPDDGTSALFKRLVDLHPGMNQGQVIARAMSIYHAIYESHLEGDYDPVLTPLMEKLDELEEQKG